MIHTEKKYGGYIRPIITLTDFLIINAIFFFIVLTHTAVENCGRLPILFTALNLAYMPVIFLLSSVTINMRSLHIERVVANSLKAVTIHALCFITSLFFLDVREITSSTVVIFYAACYIAIPLNWVVCRMIMKHFREKGYNYVRCVIIGTSNSAKTLAENMVNDPGYGYQILGYFDIAPSRDFEGNYIGTLDSLEQFVIDNRIDEIYFTLSGENPETIVKVMKIAEDNVAKFYYIPRISRFINRNFKMLSIGTSVVLSLHPTPLSNKFNSLSKRIFDILFAGIFMIFSPIFFIPVAIAIKTSSPGPVFFKQKRTGYQGKEFLCYKFRTMKVNVDADKLQATANDPRKTKIGDFLRRTSIDELPQFINVLKGDMSVVGPRPHMLKHTEDYTKLIDQYMVRHMVRPGITGWAQVNGFRGETKYLWQMQGRVERDVWYIEHWNFLLDLKIIAKTITNAIRGEKNAF